MVDSGVAAVVANVLMPSMTVVAEFATISVISIGLLIMDWKIALATFVYLGLIALLLSRVVTPKAVRNGAVNRDNSIRVVRLLGEVLAALKELTLTGNENDVADIVADRRSKAATTRAFAQYYNQMPRFVLDAGMVGGFVVVGGVGYLGGLPDAGPTAAMTSVALFAVAGCRLVPSLSLPVHAKPHPDQCGLRRLHHRRHRVRPRSGRAQGAPRLRHPRARSSRHRPRRRHLHLSGPGRARGARRVPADPGRLLRRLRRQLRRGQVHARGSAAGAADPQQRADPHRRNRHDHGAAAVALLGRLRAPGGGAVRCLRGREHRPHLGSRGGR